MAHKTLVGGTVYSISGGKTLVNGTAYKVSGGKTLVGGTGYGVQFGTPISSLAVGKSVYLKVNGTRKEFIIVHKGRPSTMYDTSCDGIWLLMKDVYSKRVWDSTNNDYKNSDIHTYLNGTFLNLFESSIKALIKQAKIPYQNGTGSGGSIASGSSGLSTKIFLLSAYEVGWTDSNISTVVDGAKLSYFTSGVLTAANNQRIANFEGAAFRWWLRSPRSNSTTYSYCADTDGTPNDTKCTLTTGIRPALILPTTAVMDENYNVI